MTKYAIQQWKGYGQPYTGKGSWEDIDNSFDYPSDTIEEAIGFAREYDLPKGWVSDGDRTFYYDWQIVPIEEAQP